MESVIMPSRRAITGADLVANFVTSDDRLSVRADDLFIEECRAAEIVSTFGSPLYVYSETTLRDNFRRIAAALAAHWPSQTRVLYAIKANNNLAIRSLLTEVGAGGDCSGAGELYATLTTGTDPSAIVMNGSTKTHAELAMAISSGVMINIDSLEEIDQVGQVCREIGQTARVSLRLRLDDGWAVGLSSDFYAGSQRTALGEALAGNKWGFSSALAIEALRALSAIPTVDLVGYHLHVGRLSREPEMFRRWADALGTMTVDLHRRTGFWPRVLNVGGGWPRRRDIESNIHGPFGGPPLQTYFQAVASALQDRLAAVNEPLPELWIESGRYLLGNAGVLLTTVTTIKRDLGRTWINVDASTNLLMRIEMQGVIYPVVPTTGLMRTLDTHADIVGSSCLQSILRDDYLFPNIKHGEILAVLDTGVYAEVHANQFNGLTRPASVLVNGDQVEIIKEREEIHDVFSKHRVPNRLMKSKF